MLWPLLDPRSARLYVLIARKAKRAVVFRRGPAKQTLVLTWDLASDTLTEGQWLKGRIYERRSDLSPDGELLLYAALKGGSELYTYTAASRPPYLTALALWTDAGMWGGGHFGSDWRSIQLNQFAIGPAAKDKDAGAISPKLRVSLLPHVSDLEMSLKRLAREGWEIQRGERSKLPRTDRYSEIFDPPIVQTKVLRRGLKLVVEMHATQEANGRPYVETASVKGEDGATRLDLGRVDWTDVDHRGDILIASNGCLRRLKLSALGDAPGSEANTMLIADLNSLRFRPLQTPARALRWP